MNERDVQPVTDAENPWPGLATFTEAQSGQFHGRDEEIRDLTRRTERNALTVLFGQSGLGKSSLLQAGVFPRLRRNGYWPIYVRLDHGPGAPTPTEQIKALVHAETAKAGTWTQPGSARPGESLWEFFHHRDDRLVAANGKAIVPVLVFDQFEELFTLGAGAGGGADRARAVAFMGELAELVENRPAEQLVARLEESSAEMEVFDFGRTDYRVVITLREDFLPHLEGLKTIMPALMENRMRLARMTGTQALEAVVKPGGALVTEEVARAIVEFVAGAKGGSVERLAELDVEPPLLSVICRELNERRKTQGQARISADLVSGNRREILTDFYERSVADLPEAMRTFVEDRLLTKSGFRDNLALETALEEPGVTRALIDTLVARRLLRIEDRLGVQRVELTHDVLAEVIRASRDARQQRLALVAERKREQATRRRMWIARGIAAGLSVVLAGVSWIAWRAVQAEREQERLRVREAALRRDAESRRVEEARRWSRSDLVASARFLAEGRTQEGIAHLVRSARLDPENQLVTPRLITSLAGRSFVRILGAPDKLPSGLSSDGHWPVFFRGLVGSDRTIHVFDPETGSVLHSLPGEQNEGVFLQGVLAARFVADRPGIRLFDTRDGRQVGSVPVVALPWGTTLFSEPARILVKIRDTKAELWDYPSGRSVGVITEDAPITRVVLSSDGRFLATGVVAADKPRVRVWAVPQRTLVSEIEAREFVRGQFSRDNRLIALGGRAGFQLHDVTKGKPVGPFLAHEGVDQIGFIDHFSEDSKRFVSTSINRSIKVWQVGSGEPMFSAYLEGGLVVAAKFVAGGQRLFAVSIDEFARVWDLATGALIVEPHKIAKGGKVTIDASGSHMTEVTQEGEIRRLRVESMASRALVLPDRPDAAVAHGWLGGRPATIVRVSRTAVTFIDAATLREVPGGFALAKGVREVRLDGKGRFVLTKTDAGAVQVWTLGTEPSAPVPLTDFPPEWGLPQRFSADGTLAAARGGAGLREVRVWNLRTGRPVGGLAALDAEVLMDAAEGGFSPDLQRLAVSGRDKQAKIWEIESGRVLLSLDEMNTNVRSLEFSPDGGLLASVELGTQRLASARFWDAATGKPASEPLRHQGNFGSMWSGGFTRNGRWFLTYSRAIGSMVVWDTATGLPVGPQIEHPARIWDPVFSPDETRVLSGCADGAARIWDIRTGQLVGEPMWHGAPAQHVRFSPDGRFILTSGGNVPAKVWPAPPLPEGGAPEWLLRLATLSVGAKIDENGSVSPIEIRTDDWETLRREVAALPRESAQTEWARWLVASAEQRTVAPGFSFKAKEAEARGLLAPVVGKPLPVPTQESTLYGDPP